MKVLLVSANTEKINILPLPLGLICVAVAVRSAGHELKLIDLMAEEDSKSAALHVMESVRSFRPDVIGVSVRNIDNQDMADPVFFLDPVRAIIAECRAHSEAAIVLGGAGFSIFPQASLNYLGAHMGIRGEGERAFVSLLDALSRRSSISRIPGLYTRDSAPAEIPRYVEDLDELPLPDPEIASQCAPDKGELWMPFQTRRGCPMGCSYCSTPALEGCTIRKRRVESVIKSLGAHIDAGFKKFYFVDNTFNMPLSYAKEICRAIISSGLSMEWRCIVYPSGMDSELAKLLSRAGCREAGMGFESASSLILHNMNKKFSPQDVEKTSDMLKAEGVRRMGFLLLGGPGESRDTVEESLAFADRLKMDAMKITTGIRIYPETALAGTAVADGLISPEDDLLFPKFYMVPGLEKWLRETVRTWMADRPEWMF
jgi:radical SAM superfamily enzyme YgiQ (UPF0313 family)